PAAERAVPGTLGAVSGLPLASSLVLDVWPDGLERAGISRDGALPRVLRGRLGLLRGSAGREGSQAAGADPTARAGGRPVRMDRETPGRADASKAPARTASRAGLS